MTGEYNSLCICLLHVGPAKVMPREYMRPSRFNFLVKIRFSKISSNLSFANEIQVLSAHSDWITCCCLSVDEKLFFTGGKDAVIKIWDAETLTCRDAYMGHRGPINSIRCVNEYIFSSSNDRTVRVWKLEDDESKVKEIKN